MILCSRDLRTSAQSLALRYIRDNATICCQNAALPARLPSFTSGCVMIDTLQKVNVGAIHSSSCGFASFALPVKASIGSRSRATRFAYMHCHSNGAGIYEEYVQRITDPSIVKPTGNRMDLRRICSAAHVNGIIDHSIVKPTCLS